MRPTTSAFLALPLELRLQCYSYLFKQHKRELKSRKYPKSSRRFAKETLLEYPGILVANKEIRAEALPLYDRLAVLRLSGHSKPNRWFKSVPDAILDVACGLEIMHRESDTRLICWDRLLNLALRYVPALRVILEMPGYVDTNSSTCLNPAFLHCITTGQLGVHVKQVIALRQAKAASGREIEIWLHCLVQTPVEEADVRVLPNMQNFTGSFLIGTEYVKKSAGPVVPNGDGRYRVDISSEYGRNVLKSVLRT